MLPLNYLVERWGTRSKIDLGSGLLGGAPLRTNLRLEIREELGYFFTDLFTNVPHIQKRA